MTSHCRKTVEHEWAEAGTNGVAVAPQSTHTLVSARAGLRVLMAGGFLPSGIVGVRFVLLRDSWGQRRIRVLISGDPRDKLNPKLRAALTRCFIRHMRRANCQWPTGIAAPHEWEILMKDVGLIAVRRRGRNLGRMGGRNLSPGSSPRAAVKTLARQSACEASRVRGARES
jgi:hypothetical protein